MSFTGYLYGLATDSIPGFIPGVLTCLLFVLSLVYGLLVRMAIFFCGLMPRQLGLRVISVGNITLGGTGKTLLVQAIARLLNSQGRRVAVLTRGYKRHSSAAQGVDDYRTVGDEAFMMSQKLAGLPVLVDADRVRAAARAIREFQADIAVLDDGFQQWRIHKDLEIVTIDARNPFGNRHLIPRGILRQPLSTLGKADVLVLTDADAVEPARLEALRALLSRLSPGALLVRARRLATGVYRLGDKAKIMSPESLKDKRLTLFCGIGNPESFRSLAVRLGVSIEQALFFPDHHPYTEEDIEGVFRRCRAAGGGMLLTTEKDAVRIPLAARKRFGNDILVLAVELTLDDEEKRFTDRLLSVYPA